MSEMVEIEVGANLGRFHTAMSQIKANLGALKTGAGNINFKSAQDGITKLGKAAKSSSGDANSVLGLFKMIGNMKISPRTIMAMREIFKELLRMLKEFAPLANMAMNALDGGIRKSLNAMRSMLASTERLNSNFLILRKVLPVTLFRQFMVNTIRVNESIKGMSREAFGFGKSVVGAVGTSVSVFEKMVNAVRNAEQASISFLSSLSKSTIEQTSAALGEMKDAMSAANTSFREAGSVTGGIKASILSLAESFGILGQSSQKTEKGFSTLRTLLVGTSNVMKSFTKIVFNVSAAILRSKAASAVLTAGLLAVARVGQLAGRALVSMGVRAVTTSMNLLAKSAKATVAPVRAVASQISSVVATPIQSASAAFQQVGKTVSGSIGVIKTATLGITALGTALNAIAMGSVVKFNKEWKKTMAEMPNAGKAATDKIKKDMRELQMEMGILTEDALPALQTALKKGFGADNSVDLVRQSALLAKTEVIDLNGAVDTIGNSMRAFAAEGLTAAEATDKLFVASKQGGISFNELNGSIRRLAPDIAATGLSFDEFLASLSVLTKKGKTTTQAFSDIQRLTNAIVKPSELGAKAFKEVGVGFGQANVAGKGLSGVLAEIQQATGGNLVKMAEMLGGWDNLNVALNLGGKNAKLVQDNLKGLGNAAGTVGKEANKMQSSFDAALNKIKVKLEFLKVDMATMLKPAITAIGEWLAVWIEKISFAIKVANQLFSNGDLGSVILDSVIVAVGNIRTMVSKVFLGLAKGLGQALAAAFMILPDVAKGVVQNILARLAKIGIFFVDLGGQMIIAFNKPIAFLQAGLIKAVEEASAALSALPIIGDGGKTKARAFEVILKEKMEEGAGAKLGKRQRDVAADLGAKADRIIQNTNNDVAKLVGGIGDAFNKGFEQGADGVQQNPEIAKREIRMHEKIKKAVDEVNKMAAEAEKKAKDAKLDVGAGQQAVVGQNEAGGLADQNDMVASSLAAIGGGGGVFGAEQKKMDNLLQIQQQQLEVQKLQYKALQNGQKLEVNAL